MFADAIERVGGYTRALHIIRRHYGENNVSTDCGTLFFVNRSGWALTSKHVAAAIPVADQLEKKYKKFLEERENLTKDQSYRFELKLLEKRYNYQKDVIMQLRNSFVGCVEGGNGFNCKFHPRYDLALIHFNDPTALRYEGAAVFAKNPPRVGDTLCRLGYAFPEFNNYCYNEEKDAIEFTGQGNPGTPRFPLDGMVTRFLRDDARFFGIELTTPGLPGLSGAPLFDSDGKVYGLQFATRPLYIGTDVKDIPVPGSSEETMSDRGFIRLGQCVHLDVIKDFLQANGVSFTEE